MNLDDKLKDSYTVAEIVENRAFFENHGIELLYGWDLYGYFQLDNGKRVSVEADKIIKVGK